MNFGFQEPEKALLAGVEFFREKYPLSLSLPELKRLAETAGARVAGTVSQKRVKPDQKYFIGAGKIEELKNLISSTGADLLIFDHDLSPSQARNLEQAIGIRVLNRTELILDIFARHAMTREGRLQVELAQYNYLLTRLTGHGTAMSRPGGGIGTRGPGETKLEYDRRRIRRRIAILNEEIEKVRQEREILREKRRRNLLPAAAIIGYTNAGKSTLLNALTGAGVLVEDKLFATLDPTTRRLYLPSGRIALLSDTVGFIENLPHQLIAAFRATLEEVSEADLLLHVVDASSPHLENQIAAVYKVLEELNSITKPILTIFNKVDLAENKKLGEKLKKYQPACAVSALKKDGLENLLATIDGRLPSRSRTDLPSAGQKYPA